MRLHLDFLASIPKDPDAPTLNEDAIAHDPSCARVAVSDGASESFDSRRWSRLLVDKYVLYPSVSPAWVDEAVAEYISGVAVDALSWSQQAAYERGSFATLLGVHLPEGAEAVEVVAIGDSLACHLRNGDLLATFPYSSAEDFDQRPTLLSTIAAKNSFLEEAESGERPRHEAWSVRPGDVLLLLTDAVAEWLLRERFGNPSATSVFSEVGSEADFWQLVATLRSAKRMRRDDSTAIRIVIHDD